MWESAIRSTRRPLIALVIATLGAGCTDHQLVAPEEQPPTATARAARAEAKRMFAILRRETARYHKLDAAVADGFVFFHACEVRPGEGAVGALYVNFDRLLDGVIDPELPDALVYEPARNGRTQPRLVAVELAMPFALWSSADPPTFLGHAFQSEDEFGVYGLHVWVWRENPEGMFAEANPRVSC